MNDMISQEFDFIFPTEEELSNVTNLKDVQQRIKDVVMILSDFKRLRDANRYDAADWHVSQRKVLNYFISFLDRDQNIWTYLGGICVHITVIMIF